MANAKHDENHVPALTAHSSVNSNASVIPLTASADGSLNTNLSVQVNSLSYSDGPQLDAFSRLRTSTPETLLAIQQQYNNATIQMEAGNSGTGVAPTYDSNTRMTTLSATSGSGTSYMQSFQYTPYQPGKSQFVAITGVMGAATGGAVKEFGYFDSANGIIYRQNGTNGLQLVLRSSTSGGVQETVVNQASWNIDTFGAGVLNPSGITLDPTKSFILMIDLQYLGMGRVRIGFDVGGQIFIAHQFLNANVLAVPYMQTPALPIQVLLTATNTLTTANMYFKCATVQSEGGSLTQLGYEHSTPQGTAIAPGSVRTHVLSVRPKTTYNSLTNRELFIAESVNMIATGSAPLYWELVVGANFGATGPTYADINTAFSAYEYGTGGTFKDLNNGAVLSSGFVASSTQAKQAIETKLALHHPIALNRAGNQTTTGTLSLLASGVGSTGGVAASIDFTEIR